MSKQNIRYYGIVYSYTNIINCKKYIGLTYRELERKTEHKSLAFSKSGILKNSYFHNAIRKYGYSNFKYNVLFRTFGNLDKIKIVLDAIETYYIRKFDTSNKEYGYNIDLGGHTSRKRSRLVDIYTKDGNYIETLSTRDICVKYNRGLSDVLHSIHNPTLFCRKYLLRLLGSNKPLNFKRKSKHIYLLMDLNNNIIAKWDSVCDIENQLGYCASTIIKYCNHPETYKSYKGYKWSRVNII